MNDMISPKFSIVVPFVGSETKVLAFLKHWRLIIDLPLIEELILVDNNIGAPVVKLKPYNKVRFVKCDKKGPASARNLGVKHVKSEWVWFTDIDCVPGYNDFLLLISEIEQSGADAVQGQISIVGKGLIVEHYRKFNAFSSKYSWDIITACFFIKSTSFSDLGGFNESFSLAGGEDTEFGERMVLKHKILHSSAIQVNHLTKNSYYSFLIRNYRYGVGTGLILKKRNEFRFIPSNPGMSRKLGLWDNFCFSSRWLAFTAGRMKAFFIGFSSTS
jgi:glycosyltransferase involved in cell wall biosynthesis